MDKIFKPATEPVFKVCYRDLEKLIEKALGLKRYEIVADEELRNDMSVVFNIREDWNLMYPWDHDKLAKGMLAGKFEGLYNLGLCMLYLRDEGIIVNGTYIIDVSW